VALNSPVNADSLYQAAFKSVESSHEPGASIQSFSAPLRLCGGMCLARRLIFFFPRMDPLREIVIQPHFGHDVQLAFEIVDVFLFVDQDLLE
jgi:hypothetical protein